MKSCAGDPFPDDGLTAPPLAAGTPGKSKVTVSPPPGVWLRLAVPPLEVTSRCTMARPSPVPLGLEVLNRRNARSPAASPSPLLDVQGPGFQHDVPVIGHGVPRRHPLLGRLAHVHRDGHRHHVLGA